MQGDGGSSASQLFCNHKIDHLYFLTGLLNVLNLPLGYVCGIPHLFLMCLEVF